MRAGDRVVYAKGRTEVDAVVVAVTGSGPSGYKTLDLEVGGKSVKAVPHELDNAGKGCWKIGSARRSVQEAPHAPPPVEPESSDKGRVSAGGGGDSEA